MREIKDTWKKHPSSTDMEILKKISNSNISRISYLPSGSKIATNKHNHLTQEAINELQTREIRLNGIVDVAPYGMWLCGIDPKNHFGKQLLFSKTFI